MLAFQCNPWLASCVFLQIGAIQGELNPVSSKLERKFFECNTRQLSAHRSHSKAYEALRHHRYLQLQTTTVSRIFGVTNGFTHVLVIPTVVLSGYGAVQLDGIQAIELACVAVTWTAIWIT